MSANEEIPIEDKTGVMDYLHSFVDTLADTYTTVTTALDTGKGKHTTTVLHESIAGFDYRMLIIPAIVLAVVLMARK